jgi:hypothetical protein
MSFQKNRSENNANILSQKTKRPRRKRFNLEDAIVCQENMDTLFNLTFKQILRTREESDFTVAVRSYFVDELESAKEGIGVADQYSGNHLKQYLLSKAKIAVIDLMLSDDVQQTIRAASGGQKSSIKPSSAQEAGALQHVAE